MVSCKALEKKRIKLIDKRLIKLKKPGYLKSKQFRKDRAMNISIIKQQQKKRC